MISFSKIENDKHEKKLIKLRKMVNELYFKHHLSKTAIAHKKRVSRDFVRKWTKSRDLNFFSDKVRFLGKEETLYIYFEKEKKPKIIKKVPFKINQKSKEKFQKLLKIK